MKNLRVFAGRVFAGSYSPGSKMFCWVELQLYKIKVTKVNL